MLDFDASSIWRCNLVMKFELRVEMCQDAHYWRDCAEFVWRVILKDKVWLQPVVWS